MAESNTTLPDPMAMWREWVATSERQWNGFLNNAMATDEFSQAMGRFMDVYLGMQKNMNEVMGRYLQMANVPTRSDVLSLGERLTVLEERLIRIEQLLTRAAAAAAPPAGEAAAPAAKPRPPRTRKPQKA
jgi:polyhydroxyalkanoic acid synthase PhaR subunit